MKRLKGMSRLRWIMPAFFVALKACTFSTAIVPTPSRSQPAGPIEGSFPLIDTSEPPCVLSDNVSTCLGRIEAKALNAFGSQVSRGAGELCFQLSNDGRTCLPSVDQVQYGFLGQSGPFWTVVESTGLEGYSVVMVSQINGTTIRTNNLPIWSPDGNYFATVSYDVDAGYSPNEVELWRVESKPQRVFSVSEFPDGQGQLHAKWISSSALEVLYGEADLDAREARQATSVAIRLHGGNWEVAVTNRLSASPTRPKSQALPDQERCCTARFCISERAAMSTPFF